MFSYSHMLNTVTVVQSLFERTLFKSEQTNLNHDLYQNIYNTHVCNIVCKLYLVLDRCIM